MKIGRKIRGSLRRGLIRFLTLGIMLPVIALLLVQAGPGKALSALVTPINQPGFGDRQNSYAWSMQWFKGQLYVGTFRNALCVERATMDFY